MSPNDVIAPALVMASPVEPPYARAGLAARRADWTIEAYHGPEGLAQLHSAWRDLVAARADAGFWQLHGWYASYVAALETDPQALWFFVGRTDESPTVIAPLRYSRRRILGLPARVWELPRHAHLSLSDVVARPGADGVNGFARLIADLRRGAPLKWDALHLADLPEGASALAGLRAARSALSVEQVVGGCDYLELEPGCSPLERVSKNFRGNLRKARNKLNALPGVEFVEITSPAELPAAFAEFLGVEASGWKGDRGTASAIRVQPAVVRFYQLLLEGIAPPGRCGINLLRADGRCIAGQFCTTVGETVHVLKIGYDEGYARCAPGNMLLEWLLERCSQADPPIRRINLVTDAAWHRDWRTDSRPVYEGWIFNTTPIGLALSGLMRAKRRLAPLYHRVKRRAADERSRDNVARPA